MEPRPYRVLRRSSRAPLLITCEHASLSLPSGLATDAKSRLVLRSHWGWDIGIWEVVRDVSRRLRATAVGGRYSRLVVDLNRDPADPSLIRRECENLAIPFNSGLAPREIRRRLARIHAPYHAEIDAQLARRLAHGQRPVLVSFHSFTPFLNPRRRRFDAGVLFRNHARLAHRLGRALQAEGLSVRYNRPYSGLEGLIYAAARHGDKHRIPYLELEFNQRGLAAPAACRAVGRRAAAALRSILALDD